MILLNLISIFILHTLPDIQLIIKRPHLIFHLFNHHLIFHFIVSDCCLETFKLFEDF